MKRNVIDLTHDDESGPLTPQTSPRPKHLPKGVGGVQNVINGWTDGKNKFQRRQIRYGEIPSNLSISELFKKFKRSGFVVVRGLLSKDLVQRALTAVKEAEDIRSYVANRSSPDDGQDDGLGLFFQTSRQHDDTPDSEIPENEIPEIREVKLLHDETRRFLKRVTALIKPFGTGFLYNIVGESLVRVLGTGRYTKPHRDDEYLKETYETALTKKVFENCIVGTCWIPLHDCSPQQASLALVPAGEDVWEIFDYEAGDVVIFDSNTTHCSTSNEVVGFDRYSTDFRFVMSRGNVESEKWWKRSDLEAILKKV